MTALSRRRRHRHRPEDYAELLRLTMDGLLDRRIWGATPRVKKSYHVRVSGD